MEQQWEEFECMRSMFPAHDELQFDAELMDAYEHNVLTNGPRPDARLQYTIRYKDLAFGKEIPALEIAYPSGYPEHDTCEFTVHCPFLSRPQTEELTTQLTLLATGAQGQVVALQLYQQMLDVLTEAHHDALARDCDSEDLVQAMNGIHMSPPAPEGISPVVLGRRAIYFHHIINPTKRRVVKEWALELQLGGFSKIGWPGIVIVEGCESDAQEYVRRLQHLKWKQMVVRGEQTETSTSKTVGEMRVLPRGFQEFPENGMSALAAACKAAGVEELFLTTMKIYGRGNLEPGTDNEAVVDPPPSSKKPKASRGQQK